MFLLTFTVLCIFTIFIFRKKARRGLRYPPGPPADPIIGHLRHMPQEDAEEVFTRWGQTYGDVVHLRTPGQSIILLSSVDAATDILDRRSANYSSRPAFPIYELLGWPNSLTLLPYGKRFRRHRKIFQECFSRKAVIGYESVQSRSAHQLVNLLLERPEDFYENLLRYSVSILIHIIYGHAINSDDDFFFQLSKVHGDALINSGPPGGTAVDLFPILKHFPSWFPGTHFATHARSKKYIADNWLELPYVAMQETLARGENPLCFMTQQLDSYDPESANAKVELEDIKNTCATAFTAGGDTTWASLLMFVLAMVLHPEAQKLAQDEIDTVIGSERLPSLSDRSKLPLVDGVVQEVLRWHPATPMGVPHLSVEDDVYNGMFIPKGSIVFANLRAMALDTRVYSDPYVFNPLRYLPHPRGNNEPPFSPAFGFGRRICPGRHLAETNLWISISTLLATMKFSRFVNEVGNDEPLDVKFITGLTSHPKPFKCKIRSRNPKVKELINHSVAWGE